MAELHNRLFCISHPISLNMALREKDAWIQFIHNAGIPSDAADTYAAAFVENCIIKSL